MRDAVYNFKSTSKYMSYRLLKPCDFTLISDFCVIFENIVVMTRSCRRIWTRFFMCEVHVYVSYNKQTTAWTKGTLLYNAKYVIARFSKMFQDYFYLKGDRL